MSPAAGYNPIMDVKAQLARAVPKAPTIDEEALKQAYAQSPIAAEPDTFCLVRVVGNDLPPRHRIGQARQNVRFTLENEADFPDCHKHWVINRILVPEEQAALIELIESFGQTYEVVPFDLDAYARTPWDFEAFDQPIATDAKVLRELGGDRADTALDQLYRHKNCYVMNNNGARNTALRAGQKRAKWALPWDGNCFVTPAGWRQISDTIRAKPYLPYFIVPMARVLDNQALLQDDFVPNAVEEPQVAFRRDAPDRFDERYRYGRRPKVEFLWRIGVPGPWDTWRNNSWDAPFPSLCERAGQFAGAGWVARLFSGESHLEAAEKASAKSRAVARQTAISEFIDALDARVLEARTSTAALLSLDEAKLDRQGMTGQPEAAMHALSEAADTLDAREAGVAQRVFVLALAARLHGRSEYGAKAQELLRAALTEDQAGPLLSDGEVWCLTDAVRLLAPGDEILQRFSEVLGLWLDRQTERMRAEPFEIVRELDVLAAAHFGGDWRLVAASLRRLTERAYHGGCGFDLAAESEVAAARHLQRWVNAASVAERLGCDLWNERDASGNGLEHALQRLLNTQWAEAAPEAQPLRRAVIDAYPCFEPEPASGPHDGGNVWPDPESGIRPFWMLG